MAYNTLVRPKVEYASVVWSPYTKDNINKIEKPKKGSQMGLEWLLFI